MKAHAQVAVSASADGHTRYDELRSDAPILLRPGSDALYIVGGAASPLGGDDLQLEIEVESGVSLVVRSVAASLARPGLHGLPSMMSIRVCLAGDAALRWLVEPAVACSGCDHYVDTVVDMAEGSSLYWRDELVLGRQGEEPGKYSSRLSVDVSGQPLVRSEFSTRWPGWNGPAVAGGDRAIGSILIAGADIGDEDVFCGQNTVFSNEPVRDVRSERLGETGHAGRGTCMSLNGPGVIVSAVARDMVALHQVVGALLRHSYII